MTFIFRPLVASEACRWSRISSLEVRSPFEYSILIEIWSFFRPAAKRPESFKKLRGYGGIVRGWKIEMQEREGAARTPKLLPCSRNARPEKEGGEETG